MMRNSKNLYIGSFYRPPSAGSKPPKQLDVSLGSIHELCKNNKNSTIILGGDFNVPHIDWESGTFPDGIQDKNVHQAVLTTLADNNLTQIQKDPTRLDNVLDLYCTNKPGLVKSNTTIPGISDHEIIVTDSNLRPEFQKKTPRKIFKYKEANWETIRKETEAFTKKFLDEMEQHTVDENWGRIKEHLSQTMETHIPSKMSTTRYSFPWITQKIKRMCKKKHRFYNRARRTKTQKH